MPLAHCLPSDAGGLAASRAEDCLAVGFLIRIKGTLIHLQTV